MKRRYTVWIRTGCCLLAVLPLAAGFLWLYTRCALFGYARPVSEAEQLLRDRVVATAEEWLGCRESDGSHRPIIDLYNRHTPLAQGYTVTYEDNWCAAFVSAAAIRCGITDILPTECGCQRQIDLFTELGRWIEDDSYIPLPGDCIYYCWDGPLFEDNTGWSGHVGIVAGTAGPFIKVIEGNYGNAVAYRILPVNSPGIRGYGIPDYAGAI